ncbi:RNA-directed DNA polymerase, eukaryota [Tanacetum coccineum]
MVMVIVDITKYFEDDELTTGWRGEAEWLTKVVLQGRARRTLANQSKIERRLSHPGILGFRSVIPLLIRFPFPFLFNSRLLSMGFRNQNSLQSKFDQTSKISKSVFISNFPDGCNNRDLWKVCNDYGTVVDVFIPNKKSKAGKRFAFVRFIKVLNLDRLIENLNTIWIGRFHLTANPARFERAKASPIQKDMPVPPGNASGFRLPKVQGQGGSYVNVLTSPILLKPTLVLDDSCLVNRDLENYVMGEVLQFSSINNLQVLLSNEGFHNARIVYLGGLWNGLFWVDIEGVPLNAWSRLTFQKIGSKWGEMVELEDGYDDLFTRKRICIKTNQAENILESFKLIVKGKVFWARAKELFVWSPSFKEVPEKGLEHHQGESPNAKEASSDPFSIYDLLEKRTKEVRASGTETSIPYPPGFTPVKDIQANNEQAVPDVETNRPPSRSERSNSRILEEMENSVDRNSSESRNNGIKLKEGGSILEILEEMITVGQTMGFSMEGLGSKAKKDWIRELTTKHKVSFLSIQETKMECVSAMEVKFLWGNYFFDHIVSEACGNSGGILCTWDTNIFQKEQHIISDNFVALYGTWIPNKQKLLLISVYAPQSCSSKRMLWSYLASLITSWNGESLIMGDFNEVRSIEERWGSVFNVQGANAFNSFISSSGLIDIQLEGYSFTWAHPSATKMSKLDRFLMSNGLLSTFPLISAICLDRHLSDHRPILLREVISDFGPTPFRFYHSWLGLPGFDELVKNSWNSFVFDDSNEMIRFKKKLQMLKKVIRTWTMDHKRQQVGRTNDLKTKLCDIDKMLDQGGATDDILLSRMEVLKQLHDVQASNNRDFMQKAKVRWAIEGDENSKYFHTIINKKRANLSVKGVMVDGDWIDDPYLVKQEFRNHFADRFQDPGSRRGSLNFLFPNRLRNDQILDLESPISNDEIRTAVWGCGEDKSPGPDGFTFEFFRKYWAVVGPDFSIAVEWFFEHGDFAIGCSSSFVALIPKVLDPKVVSDYRPISLIGSLYKVVTKILATRLSMVISDLISDVQTAFLPNRQILDGPFIINEILARCKLKKQQAMIFKVDFAKAYDSIRWDFLDDVLNSFGFGSKWRSWIRGSLSSGKASILVNGSPTSEFHLHRGLKQGDPLAPFLFILIMESLHLSFSRAVEAGIFTSFRIDPSITLSHLFYADDAVFIGEWSHANLKGIINILWCFSLLSGMSINIQKSHLLGVGIPDNIVAEAGKSIGCSIMKAPFKYLGISVGDNMSSIKAWDETITKMKKRKIAWVKWSKVLASKKYGGLGVSSFYALNRALLFKWVWRYLSHDNSLWFRVIAAIHDSNGQVLSASYHSTWSSIIKEVNSLKDKGVDLISHCKIRVGKGTRTSFWNDFWIGDSLLKHSFPRLYALEENKDLSVANTIHAPITSSFRRLVRGGVESQQLDHLLELLGSVILSNMEDRWFWDLNGVGVFRVKDVRNLLDESFLPKVEVPTRWIKSIPIKVNVFAWKLFLDRLPTRSNLARRNVTVPSLACSLCDLALEDSSHLFFGCSVAKDVLMLVCRWWNLGFQSFDSYDGWLSWFKSIRLGSKSKDVLEGVFYVSWWSLWNYRNQLLFAVTKPRKNSIFDDIILRSFTWCVARVDENDKEEEPFDVWRSCWVREEEILLTECWIETSENGQIGADRSEDSINGDCQKFNAIYDHLERKSGANEADHIEAAKITFATQQPTGRKFQLEHCWRILKGHSKWDAPKPLDTENHTEIFGPDVRPSPAEKNRPAKKTKSETTGSTGGSASGSLSDYVLMDYGAN